MITLKKIILILTIIWLINVAALANDNHQHRVKIGIGTDHKFNNVNIGKSIPNL